MQIAQFISVLIILIAMIFTCDSQMDIRLCGRGGCNENCDECLWGSVYNEVCGYEECGKGPGDWCNENRDDCGESLQCRCGKCHGCSSTSIQRPCHSSSCLPIKNWLLNM